MCVPWYLYIFADVCCFITMTKPLCCPSPNSFCSTLNGARARSFIILQTPCLLVVGDGLSFCADDEDARRQWRTIGSSGTLSQTLNTRATRAAPMLMALCLGSARMELTQLGDVKARRCCCDGRSVLFCCCLLYVKPAGLLKCGVSG